MARTTPRPMTLRVRDLSPAQKAGVVAVGAVQVILAFAARTDLARRPSAQVRGGAGRCAAIIALTVVGPALYAARGLRRLAQRED